MSLFTALAFALSPMLRCDEIFIVWELFSFPSSCMTKDGIPNAPNTYLTTLIFYIIMFAIIKPKWNKKTMVSTSHLKNMSNVFIRWLLCSMVQE